MHESRRMLLLAFVPVLRSALLLQFATAGTGDEFWDTQFGVPGANTTVSALLYARDSLYAAGQFGTIGGTNANHVARWDGVRWHPLRAGFTGGFFPVAGALAARGNDIFAAGAFEMAGGVSATNIARWDGTNWSPLGFGVRNFNGAGSENGSVKVIFARAAGVFVGGSFNLAGTHSAGNIARWDGVDWFSTGQGSSGTVQTIVPNGDDLYSGGSFGLMDGLPVFGIAKWNGTTWSALGSGLFFGGSIAAACNGSELFLGGAMKTAGTMPSTNIALWHIPHSLNISRAGTVDVLSWPATGTNFLLEATTNLESAAWSVVSQCPLLVNDQCVVTNPAPGPSLFYRLRRR